MTQPNLGTVLLVDDCQALLRNLAFLLNLTGFETLIACDGAEALRLLESHSPDLIISDIQMPTMNGYDLLHSVRADARWQAIPFIIASVQYDLDDLLFGLDKGADDYIPKPYDIFDVLDAIHRTVPELVNTAVLQQPQIAS